MKIPLFPLDVALLPGAALPLHIFEDRYKLMIGECLVLEREFGVVRAQRDGLAVVGCTASISQVTHRYPDGRFDILCHGRQRFEIELLDNSKPYLQAEVDFFEDSGDLATRAAREECAALHFEALELAELDNPIAGLDLDNPIAFQLAAMLPTDTGFKQMLLNSRSDADRTARLLDFYATILPKLRNGAGAGRTTGGNDRVM